MDHLSTTYAALADPTRRAILARLSMGETTVGELAEPFDISAPAISRHLKVLEQAGLVERKVEAQFRRIRLNPDALEKAEDWIANQRRFWNSTLDHLEKYLTKQKERKEK